jgi:pantoate--beta-alanine ligase
VTEVIHHIADLRARLDGERCAGRTVGFVPTMGALHDGHLSLIRTAAAADDVVLVSVFVNPLQFAPHEDLDAYPRNLDGDVALAAGAGAHLVFAPSVSEMYPQWPIRTTVSVSDLSIPMEGEVRPHFFAGVATVVTKLFAIAGPCRAYFGEKDFQQLAVIRQMAADLSLPVGVVGCPTVREPDGLAMSSRNVYLTAQERAASVALSRALAAGVAAIEAGERDPEVVRSILRRGIEPVAPLDYAEVVDAATLQPVDPLAGTVRLLVAARFGAARLIDNMGVTVGA